MSDNSQKNKFRDARNIGRDVHIGDTHTENKFYADAFKPPKELTTILPRTNRDEIIGREGDLQELENLLYQQKRMVVVHGFGGVGKTTLAQVYVAHTYEKYQHIAWITQTSDDLASDFINTDGLLQALNIKENSPEPAQVFKEIIKRMKAFSDGPNLLVIDNAEPSLANYIHSLPAQPNWHVLITSRDAIDHFHVKKLDFLSEDEAVALFRKYYPLPKLKKEDIRKLVELVDRHTLTVEVLAKTAAIQRYDLAKLQKAIEDDLVSHAIVIRGNEQVERVGSYLSTVFNLSKLGEKDIWLMKQLVCLPTGFHTYDFLQEVLEDQQQEGEASLAEVLANLAKKGWLLYNQEIDGYKIHGIIMRLIVKHHPIKLTDVEGLVSAITDNLHIDQTKDNPIEKFAWVPFGRLILAQFAEDTSAKISTLQNNLALVLQDLGDYQEAKQLLEKALRSDEANFGPDHPTIATRYSNLATVLQDLGDYQGAKELLGKALRSDEINFGPEHPTTAIRYSNLALVLRDLGDYQGAKELLGKALHSAEINFGPEHPVTATRYSNLALVLQNLGDYQGAKELLGKALRSDEINFGPEHPATALRYSNLATVLRDLGDYQGAKELLEKALRSAEINFGPEHPATALPYSNLALVLRDLGDYQGAKKLLEKVLRSDEINFGPEHPTTAIDYSNLATVLQNLGDYQGAKGLLEKALRSDEINLGPEHPTTAIDYSNLALVLQNLGDYQRAKELLEKAMHSAEINFGAEHPNTATNYSNLATLLQDLGDYQGAKELTEKALHSAEVNFGVEHPTTAIRYSNLALVLEDLGDYQMALLLTNKALAIFKKILPEGHPHIGTVMRNYEMILKAFEEHKKQNPTSQ